MRCSYYPQSLVRIRGANWEIGSCIILSCPGYTGMTGALDRSDRCEPFVGFSSGELLVPCVFGLCCCWSVLGLFGVVLLGFVKDSSSLQVVLWRCFCFRA
jgi:hypothetical protein